MLRFSRFARVLCRASKKATKPQLLLSRPPVVGIQTRFIFGEESPPSLSDEDYEAALHAMKSTQTDQQRIDEFVQAQKHSKEQQATKATLSRDLPLLPSNSDEVELCALWSSANQISPEALKQVEEDFHYFYKLFHNVPTEEDRKAHFAADFKAGKIDLKHFQSVVDATLDVSSPDYQQKSIEQENAKKILAGEYPYPDEGIADVEDFFMMGTAEGGKWFDGKFRPYSSEDGPSTPAEDRPVSPLVDEQVECHPLFFDYMKEKIESNSQFTEFDTWYQFFTDMMAEHRNEVHVLIESAEPLNDAQRERLLKAAQKQVPEKSLLAKEVVKANLVAGFCLTVGEEHIDLSAASQLNGLELFLDEWVERGEWVHERQQVSE